MGEYRAIMGPTSSPFDCHAWGTFLDEHSPPEVLKEVLEMKDADADSSSDEDDCWWFEDKGDRDKKKGEGEGEGKEKDYHETGEEDLGPG
jgi:hypothetical protein